MENQTKEKRYKSKRGIDYVDDGTDNGPDAEINGKRIRPVSWSSVNVDSHYDNEYDHLKSQGLAHNIIRKIMLDFVDRVDKKAYQPINRTLNKKQHATKKKV